MKNNQTQSKQGGKRPGAGRPAGVPNKVTVEFRDTVRRVLEENSANVGVWLLEVANGSGESKPDPAKALDLLAKLAEFAAPKLSRAEHTGADGGAIDHSLTVRFVGAPEAQ